MMFMRMLQFLEAKKATMIFKGLLNNTRYIKRLELCFLIQILIVFGKVKVCMHTPVAFEVCKLMI